MSDIQICNLALGFLKAGRITAFDGSSEEATLCETFYEESRNQVFEQHNWFCLKTRVILSPDATAPAYEYTNRFLLPTECARLIVVETAIGTEITNYEIEGRYVLSDETQLNIQYVAYNTDTNLYSSMLKYCIARRLAANMCFALSGSSSAVQLAEDLYKKSLDEARSLDSSNGATGATYVSNNYMIGLLD